MYPSHAGTEGFITLYKESESYLRAISYNLTALASSQLLCISYLRLPLHYCISAGAIVWQPDKAIGARSLQVSSIEYRDERTIDTQNILTGLIRLSCKEATASTRDVFDNKVLGKISHG